MIRKKQHFLKNIVTLKNTLMIGLLYLIMALFIVPESGKQLSQYADGVQMLDQLYFYSPAQLYELIAAYGEKGRQLYIAVELSADLVFAIVTGIFIGFLLLWSNAKLEAGMLKKNHLIRLPLIYILLNFFENLGIIGNLIIFPISSYYLALATCFFTVCKWLSLLLCLGFILRNLSLLLISKTKFTRVL